LGAVPFGYVVGRCRGVDLLAVGSRNIGATNAGRVLGMRWGVLVFLLDAAKGALPVLAARLVAEVVHEPFEPLGVAAGVAALPGLQGRQGGGPRRGGGGGAAAAADTGRPVVVAGRRRDDALRVAGLAAGGADAVRPASDRHARRRLVRVAMDPHLLLPDRRR